jgi:aspartate-semialdehyde dehydrogenase
MSKYAIAIVGATGLVGTTLLSLFERNAFPMDKIYLVASEHSAGKRINFKGEPHVIYDLAQFDFHQTQIAFFCIGSDLSAQYAEIAAAAGNVVIDKSNYFRYHQDVPLVVPEVNLDALLHYNKKNIIANPNCNTIPIAVALKPIYDEVGISRINIATYQAVSGTGKDAVTELMQQTQQLLANEPIEPKVYSQQIAFNVLPHIDAFQDNGYTLEEMKMVWELQKIFNDSSLSVNPTAVRVPVFYGHAASVHIETKDKITAKKAMQLLGSAQGVQIMTGDHPYPTPIQDAAGKDDVYVGRIREDISHEKGLNLWIVADNLRKGAALNAFQIAEHLVHYLKN